MNEVTSRFGPNLRPKQDNKVSGALAPPTKKDLKLTPQNRNCFCNVDFNVHLLAHCKITLHLYLLNWPFILMPTHININFSVPSQRYNPFIDIWSPPIHVYTSSVDFKSHVF